MARIRKPQRPDTNKARRAVRAAGVRRLQVSVPSADAALLRKVAEALRTGGVSARQARSALRGVMTTRIDETGADILRFFQHSPLADAELNLERDRSTGQPIDL